MASVTLVSEKQNIKYINHAELDAGISAVKEECAHLSDDMANKLIRKVFGHIRLHDDRPSESYTIRTLALSYLKPLVKLVAEWPPYLPPDALSSNLSGEELRAERPTLRPTLEFGAIAESRQAALFTLFGLINSDAVIPIRKYVAGDKDLLRGIANSIVSGCLRNTNPLKLSPEVLSAPADAPDKTEPHICWIKNTAMGLQALSLFAIDNPENVYDLWIEANGGSPISALYTAAIMALLGVTRENPIERMPAGKTPDFEALGSRPIMRSIRVLMDVPNPDNPPTLPPKTAEGLERLRGRAEEFANDLQVPGEYDNRPFAVCFDCGVVVDGEPARAARACSGCKLVTYCNAECQKRHWKKHKKACRAFTSFV